LKKHINDLSVPTALASLMGQAFLANCSPQIMLFTINLDENYVNEKRITKSLVSSLQLGGIFWPKSIAPQSNSFVTDIYPTLS
jgi:hypothetical protein